MHGAALVAHPVGALDAFLPGRAAAVASLTLLVRVERLVVEELLQRDEEDVALHRSDAARRNHALGLAERTEERLPGADLRLAETRLEAFEAEAVQTRQQLGRVEFVAADRTVKQIVDCRRRFSSCWRVRLTLTMVRCCRRHLDLLARYRRCRLAGWRTCYCRTLPAALCRRLSPVGYL